MAIIATNHHQAEVKAMGQAMNATMTFSGAMFEMLATVYVYILMAAIREPIQNGVDAVKRKGMSAAEGVKVFLPTAENPVITVIDQGPGMTKAFMESTYLSFGSSTKAADNDSAGGLGVGRWAAYGYIRECYIVTCNEEDMVERTYFQFQGPNGTPQVQLAAEVPGTKCGTRVYFPVKETDIAEALRAVAWLKEVMQLTMGDSFSVDNPALLPKALPDFSGTRLDLEEVDPGLKGIRIYPMKGSALKYGRQGLQDGSLVVLTNQEIGVGGLPFHVQSPSTWESVFFRGMIIEIPLAYSLPFMPSREELKYTDDVNALLRRIDDAAAKLIIKKVEELYTTPSLIAKGQLSDLLGNTPDHWHWFATSVARECMLQEALRSATGSRAWTGDIRIAATPSMRTAGVQLKWIRGSAKVMKSAYPAGGSLVVSGHKFSNDTLTFSANSPMVLVLNDLPTGGTTRVRSWMQGLSKDDNVLFVTAEVMADAKSTVDEINAQFGDVLQVVLTSKLPAPERLIVGSKVVKKVSRVGMLTYYCKQAEKQKSELLSFESYDPKEVKRVWLPKDGGLLGGFNDRIALSDLVPQLGDGSLLDVLAAMKVARLYLLTPKQSAELLKAQADADAEGLFDRTSDEFSEEEGGLAAYHETCALKGWISFEDALRELLQEDAFAAVLDGRAVRKVKDSYELSQFCKAMARTPRLALTGTVVDKEFSPYIDFVSGACRLHNIRVNTEPLNRACEGLLLISRNLVVNEDDPEERKELKAKLELFKSRGYVDYAEAWTELRTKFPILDAFRNIAIFKDDTLEHISRALQLLYK